MLRASHAGATLWPEAIPALPGALALAEQGIESTLAPENSRVLTGMGRDATTALLADPQTSGGLLAGIPAGKAVACVAALRAAGMEAAIIGVVEPEREGAPAIRLAPEPDLPLFSR